MSFHEVRIDDGLVIYDTEGGPSYSTEVARTFGGAESRNQNWAETLSRWVYGGRRCTRAELEAFKAFFRARKGRLHGFRARDWGEYKTAATQGRLGSGAVGTGMPTYDLYRREEDAGGSDDKRIWKPIAAGFAVQRAGSPATLGSGAGQYSLDTVNGRVTWVADASSAISGITPGASTVVTLGGALSGLVIAGRLYLSGTTGTIATALNGIAHTITGVSGAQYTLATSTTGLVYGGGGSGYKYPQPGETLTWSGEFDLPARFDTDELRYRFLARDSETGEMLFDLDSLPVVELRTP